MDDDDRYVQIDIASLTFVHVANDSQVVCNVEIKEDEEIQIFDEHWDQPIDEIPTEEQPIEPLPIQHVSIDVPEGLYKSDKKTHKTMITHCLWPRVLPYYQHFEFEKYEISMCELMCDVLDALSNRNIISDSTVKMVKSLHNIQSSMAPDIILREINELKCGEMTAMYVKNQNCCFMVHMPDVEDMQEDAEKKDVIVSSFPVSLGSSVISQHDSNGIQVIFLI